MAYAHRSEPAGQKGYRRDDSAGQAYSKGHALHHNITPSALPAAAAYTASTQTIAAGAQPAMLLRIAERPHAGRQCTVPTFREAQVSIQEQIRSGAVCQAAMLGDGGLPGRRQAAAKQPCSRRPR